MFNWQYIIILYDFQVQNSKGTGAGLKNVYIPTLWYFEYLAFLDHKETLNSSGADTLGICGNYVFIYVSGIHI